MVSINGQNFFKQVNKIKLSDAGHKTIIKDAKTGIETTLNHTMHNGKTGKYGILKRTLLKTKRNMNDPFNPAKRNEEIIDVYENGISVIKKINQEFCKDGKVNGSISTMVKRGKDLIDGTLKVFIDGVSHNLPVIKK